MKILNKIFPFFFEILQNSFVSKFVFFQKLHFWATFLLQNRFFVQFQSSECKEINITFAHIEP